MEDFKCTYCDFQYHGRASSLLMLHECSDQEMHYIDRVDLEEEPLPEVQDTYTGDIFESQFNPHGKIN